MLRKYKYFIFCIIIILSNRINAQHLPLQISNIYSNNKITNYHGQKLILLDFWATWCIPCKASTIQLEILQEQLKEELFIVSITNENNKIVDKYINRHKIDLMVAIDINNKTIEKYNVNRRPYAILLDFDGNLIWQGHPANLDKNKILDISKHYSNRRNSKMLKDLFEIKEEAYSFSNNNTPVEQDELFMSQGNSYLENIFSRKDKYIYYQGNIEGLISCIYNIPKDLITSHTEPQYIKINIPTEVFYNNIDGLLYRLEQELNINIKTTTQKDSVFVVEDIKPNKLWDTFQIEWGEDRLTSNYIIGEERIQADNCSIAEICKIISENTDGTYIYKGYNNSKYDWDFTFYFRELMIEELNTEFGLYIHKEIYPTTRVFIEKKRRI